MTRESALSTLDAEFATPTAMANKALANALKVLLCFDAAHPEWRVADLSRATGLDKSHIAKILREFTDTRMLAQDPISRRYRVGPRALALGAGYPAAHALARQAGGILRKLAGKTGFTTTLNALDGSDVLFFMAIEGAMAIDGHRPVGAHIPWHATAAGKVHAAFLDSPALNELLTRQSLPPVTPATIQDPEIFRRQMGEIRRRGYASTRGESTPGLSALAAPVFGNTARFLGAISLLFPLDAASSRRRPQLLEDLGEAAIALSRRMGADSYPYRLEAS